MTKTSSPRILALQRRTFALELRIGGLSYREIAVEVVKLFGSHLNNYNERRAWMDVWHCIREVAEKKEAMADEALAVDLTRLDQMLIPIWDKARNGDIKAIETVIKLMERRAKLLGLDAPTKIAPTKPTGEPLFTPYASMSDGEIDEALHELFKPSGGVLLSPNQGAANGTPSADGDGKDPGFYSMDPSQL